MVIRIKMRFLLIGKLPIQSAVIKGILGHRQKMTEYTEPAMSTSTMQAVRE